MARSNEIKACSVDAMKSLVVMGLANRAEAALIEAGLTYGPAGAYVSVIVEEPGRVRLLGMVDDKTSKTRAEKIVKNVKGVESIENQIRVAPADRHA
jgi:hypothetical protein